MAEIEPSRGSPKSAHLKDHDGSQREGPGKQFNRMKHFSVSQLQGTAASLAADCFLGAGADVQSRQRAGQPRSDRNAQEANHPGTAMLDRVPPGS